MTILSLIIIQILYLKVKKNDPYEKIFLSFTSINLLYGDSTGKLYGKWRWWFWRSHREQ
jgi:hypothetical protein